MSSYQHPLFENSSLTDAERTQAYENAYSSLFSDNMGITALTTSDIESFNLSQLSTVTLPSLTGSSGQLSSNTYSNTIYTTNNTGYGAIPTISISNTSSATWTTPYNGYPSNTAGIKVAGDCEVEGSLKVKGKDITDLIANIEDRLAIYHPAPEIEEKWEKLRDLARQYKETLADIKEKEKIWDILQK